MITFKRKLNVADLRRKRMRRDAWTGQPIAEPSAEAAADAKLRKSALQGDFDDLCTRALAGASSTRVYLHLGGDMEHGRISSEITDKAQLDRRGLKGPSVNVFVRTLTDEFEVPMERTALAKLHERKKFLFLPERPRGVGKRAGKTVLLRPWGRDEDLSDTDDEHDRLFWVRCKQCGLDRTVSKTIRKKYAPDHMRFVCGFARKICSEQQNEYERKFAARAAPVGER